MAEVATIFLLGVIAVCLAAMTISLWVTTTDLRALNRQISATLPITTSALKEVRRTVLEARQFLVRVNAITHHAQEAVSKASRTTGQLFEQFSQLKERALGLWSKPFGNGARGNPRRVYRR